MATWQELLSDPARWKPLLLREKIVKHIRSFFDKQGFREVDTPMLIRHPAAESYLEVFETTLLTRHRKKEPLYLSTSPELAIKKLLVAGLGNCYALTKSFRNMETDSKTHHPEFTILEWYRTDATYVDIMEDCENLLLSILSNVQASNTSVICYQGATITLAKPWPRISVGEAFQRWAHISLEDFFDMDCAKKTARAKGYAVGPNTTWEELYHQIFLNEVEPHLGADRPTILYDFPSRMAALSKKKPNNPRFSERFEFYIGGLELGDCYSELTDWKEQEKRFQQEMEEIRRLGKTSYTYDQDFILALQQGLPPCAGIAVGVERLAMLFADTSDIRDVTLFALSDKTFA